MDFMEGGDLLTDLEKHDGRFAEATARYCVTITVHIVVSVRIETYYFSHLFSLCVFYLRFYISELICGLEFLHLNGIVHRYVS